MQHVFCFHIYNNFIAYYVFISGFQGQNVDSYAGLQINMYLSGLIGVFDCLILRSGLWPLLI